MTTPGQLKVEHCRTKECGKPIIWAETGTGKRMPVDADPVPGGNIALGLEAGVVKATVIKPHRAFGRRDLRMPHFATCPDGAAWRRRQEQAERNRRRKGARR